MFKPEDLGDDQETMWVFLTPAWIWREQHWKWEETTTAGRKGKKDLRKLCFGTAIIDKGDFLLISCCYSVFIPFPAFATVADCEESIKMVVGRLKSRGGTAAY